MMYLKKLITISLCLVLIFSLMACNSKTIGKISGPKNDYISIDNVKNMFDNENNYSSSDRNKYLGEVTKSTITNESIFCKRRYRKRIYLHLVGLGKSFLQKTRVGQIPVL